MGPEDDPGTPTVSVVVPTLDRDEMLEAAIRSVNDQTYGNVEAIVVDDSERPQGDPTSGLEPGAITDAEYISGEDHEGAGAARNTGIRAATGEFIAFLDDDDRWEPTKLERQVRAFRRSSERVGVVYTGQRYVDSDGRTRGIQNSTTRGDVTKDILLGERLNPFSCVMVRADVIEEAGYIDERLPFWEDREWYLRLSKHCVFEAIPEPLAIRRMGEHEQLGDGFEARETAYRLFLRKHRGLAGSYGPEYERALTAWLARGVALAAIRNGRYRRAVEYLYRAIRCEPREPRSYLLLVLALGGGFTYRPARFVKRKLNELRYDPTAVSRP